MTQNHKHTHYSSYHILILTPESNRGIRSHGKTNGVFLLCAGSLTNSLDTRDYAKIRTTLLSGHPSHLYFCINTYMYCDENTMYVYSLRTNTWRQLGDSPYDHSQDYRSGVSVKGFLYWIARKRSDRIPMVVAYSLADEKFSEVPSPGFYNDVDISNVFDCKLAAFGEKLAIFDHVEGVVWLMNEYGVKESWTKIVIHGLIESPLVEPMFFYDNGKIVFVNCDLKVLINVEEICSGKSDNVLWDRKVLELEVVELLFKSHDPDLFTFHGSCNGLVFASVWDSYSVHVFVIFNPTTRDLVDLPKPGNESRNVYNVHKLCGFGYDSVTDDYKSVAISFEDYNCLFRRYHRDDKMTLVNVYSLKSSWDVNIQRSIFYPKH
nr:hypothetical protein [Tanacetum cinerariifolium]